MIGSVSEWTMDWYDVDVHEKYYKKGQLKGPQHGDKKAIRGGAWDEKFWAQWASNRFAKPTTGNPDLYGSNGIRCVTPTANSLGQPQN